MIGWYIHYQGQGHLHRALTLAQHLVPETQVTGLSSLPAPPNWPGDWVQLAPDWEQTPTAPPQKPDAGGALHWAPLHHRGLRERSAQISSWIRDTAPEMLIADVSVEATLLARLHGVPVISVALPGDRTDPVHQLGYRASEAVVGFWPPSAHTMLRGLDGEDSPAFHALGGLSRFTPEESTPPSAPTRGEHVLVLNGGGGGQVPEEALAAIREALPQAALTVLGAGGSWVEDPWPLLKQADVVITSAGQNAVAEVAASRTPAVVIAQQRPYREQLFMRHTLTTGPWPAVAAPAEHTAQTWGQVLREALCLDGERWSTWCDGHAAERFLQTLADLRPPHRRTTGGAHP